MTKQKATTRARTEAPWFWSGDSLMGRHGEFASTHVLTLGSIKPEPPDALLLQKAPELLRELTTLVTVLKNNGFNTHFLKKYLASAQAVIHEATNLEAS